MPPIQNALTMEKLIALRKQSTPWSKCARLFAGVTRKSLVGWAKRNGYQEPLETISDTDLRNLIDAYCREYPKGRGEVSLQGFIVSQGYVVTRQRLRNTIRSMPEYQEARERRADRRKWERQVYYAPGIGWLWHIDTYFKLAKWGFILVGVIDGGSREMICCDVLLDKTARSVMKSVLSSDGFKKYGPPKTLSMDRGMENVALSRFMHHFGCEIHPTPSPHNIKIERWWRECRCDMAAFYEKFFKSLEKQHGVNTKNPTHIWILQYVYYDRVVAR